MCEWVVICVVLSGAGRVGLGCSAPLPRKESLERLYPWFRIMKVMHVFRC
jgi:hypothetical protein